MVGVFGIDFFTFHIPYYNKLLLCLYKTQRVYILTFKKTSSLKEDLFPINLFHLLRKKSRKLFKAFGTRNTYKSKYN